MAHFLEARSISRPLSGSLLAPDSSRTCTGLLLGAFERACDIWLPPSGVVAVVSEAIGDGPFNVVVGRGKDALAAIALGDPVDLADGCLTIGPVTVDLHPAVAWDPAPDWAQLRARLDVVRSTVPVVCEALETHTNPLLAMALGREPAGPLATAIQEATPGFQVGWTDDYGAVGRAAARLAGLGPGLTPAGDDFLLGLLAWAWLTHPSPLAFGWVVSSAAIPRTTALAGAWLQAAASGHLAAPWHRFLEALAADASGSELQADLNAILAHGATSGADALAGFLWLAQGDHSPA
jgi:hypothetical protein